MTTKKYRPVNKYIGNRRLLKLADKMDQVAIDDKPIAMTTISMGITKFPGSRNRGYHTCGTAACALGYATNIESFRRAGLHIVGPMWGYEHRIALKKLNIFTPYDQIASIFFGITPTEAINLFGPSNKNDAANIANRIRQFVVDHP